jgi:hypothetical protein
MRKQSQTQAGCDFTLPMPKLGLIQPLDHSTYDRVYNKALFPNSTEYRRADGSEGPMIYFVKKLVTDLNPKTIVSIGAGTGAYDAALLKSADCYVESYFVIEPNPYHARCVSENLDREKAGKVTVIEKAFDSSFDLDILNGVVADFVMFAHSLYFIPKPGKAIEHQAHNTAVSRFYREFNDLLNIKWDPDLPRQDHLITTKTISDDLLKLGINHKVHQEPAAFFVDSFYNDDEETVLLLLSFMMNTDVTKFPIEVIGALKGWVIKNSEFNQSSGHFELAHPQGFILVET